MQEHEQRQQELLQALQTPSTPIQQRYVYPSALTSSPPLETLIETPSTHQQVTKTPSLSQRLATTSLGLAITSFASWLLGATSPSNPDSGQLQSCSQNTTRETNSLL